MPIYRLLTAAAAVSLLAGAAMAQTPAAPAPAPAPAPAAAAAPTTPGATLAKPLVASGDTMATLRLNGQFNTLVKALDAANLSSLLQQRPNMTLFAPPDPAFAALPPGDLDKMMADPEKKDLRKLLLHHIVNAPVPTSKIKGTRGPWPTGGGDKVVLDGSSEGGALKADNATIIQPDVTTANGTIQVVDHVLIAGSVPEALSPPPPEPAATPAPEPEKPAAKAPAKKKK
jgi:uncharacterized surface protein with fasciclin (FAS1) repeats